MARLAALFIAAVIAITAITPLATHSLHPRDYIFTLAVMPTFIAWLVVRERPSARGPALFRGASVVLALVGAGGLGLLFAAGPLRGFVAEAVEAARFPIQSGLYLLAGLLGLIGSVMRASDV